MTLTRDEILQKNDTTTVEVDIPEWGGAVRVRSLTLLEQAKLADLNTQTAQKGMEERVKKAQLQLIIFCVVDENGGQMFSKDDIDSLAGKNPGAIKRIQDAVLKISAITPEAQGEAEKN